VSIALGVPPIRVINAMRNRRLGIGKSLLRLLLTSKIEALIGSRGLWGLVDDKRKRGQLER